MWTQHFFAGPERVLPVKATDREQSVNERLSWYDIRIGQIDIRHDRSWDKKIFIKAIELVPIQDARNTPTAILYQHGRLPANGRWPWPSEPQAAFLPRQSHAACADT